MGITITSATILGAPPAPQPAALAVELTVEELARALHETSDPSRPWDQIGAGEQAAARAQSIALLARFTVTTRVPTLDELRAWNDADQRALLDQIPGHPSLDACDVDECSVCAVRDCPAAEFMHYHHDGCPACDMPAPAASAPPTVPSEPPGASSR